MGKMKIIILGASGYAKKVQYMLDDEKYKIMAFLDNNIDRQGKYLNGIYIDSPNNIKKYQFDRIIISLADYQEEMSRQLFELGVMPEQVVTFIPHDKDVYWQDSRIAHLRNCVEELREKNISGNMAEVGVYKGDFAKYFNRYFPEKKLYLFDTFEGFTNKDNSDRDTKLSSNCTFKDTDIKIVLDKMLKTENCIIKQGYFPDTTKGIEDEFCLVSLDADLYKPIMAGLEYFYPRLVHGGYIFVHDYGNLAWDGVKKAVREFCEKEKISYVPIMDRCSSIIITK